MEISVLILGANLIATLPADAADVDLLLLQETLIRRIGEHRSRGVVINVTALEVMDSFAARTLRAIAHSAKLRGAHTVLVGIQPEVAFAMVQLGLTGRLEDVSTAMDLEDGLALLDKLSADPDSRQVGWNAREYGKYNGGNDA
jgi:rsbT antagonist protein RsbS